MSGRPIKRTLRGRFKLVSEIFGSTPGPDQRDHLFAKLRRVGFPGVRHRGLLLPQGLGVHGSGSGPIR